MKSFLQQMYEVLVSDIVPVLLKYPLVVAAVILISVIVVKRSKEYINNSYFRITKTPYADMEEDSGKSGEYTIYKALKKFEKQGAKFLFNVYIPKGEDETTEIDVLLICHQGILVFESKNYSGWIYGNEWQNNWCQILPTGDWQEHKEFFYNPILQNKTHIRHLKKIIGKKVYVYSLIVFSEKCRWKHIGIESENVYVTKYDEVNDVVSRICNDFSHPLLNRKEMKDIYGKLYPYSQVDWRTKKKHAVKVKRKIQR